MSLTIVYKTIGENHYKCFQNRYLYIIMDSGNIVKYSASAGSGKTHVLAKEYLYRIFENPTKYRKILAVTFTNKAAAEMKHRILDELFIIAQGENTAIFSDLKERFPQHSDERLREMSKSILSSILSDYSRFSLTTIDSFFQKVFRAFAKEIGIPTIYGLYIEYNTLLRETITDLIREMKENDVLYDWLKNTISSSYDEGKIVRLEDALYNLSKLVYSEQYKLLTDEEQSKLFDFDNVNCLKSELKKLKSRFEKSLKQKAADALVILEKNNVTSKDIYKGKLGLFGFLEKVSDGKIIKPSNTVKETLSTGNFYSSKCNRSNVDAALSDGFDVAANSVVELIEKEWPMYETAGIMQKNINYVAVLGHVVKSLRERMAYENNYVLADTGDFLRQIIGNDQTPFIYEKTGNDYDVFMIDEFQDTSIIQYHNFKSLLENSISQGFDSLVVGDAKQSIYRWRNGDWSILNEKLPKDFYGRVNSYTLNTNWRSLPEIVKFNNTLFNSLSSLFDKNFPYKPNGFSDVYNDATQNFPVRKIGGYVRMEVVDTEDYASNELSVSQKVAEIIEQCQDAGYKASDICVLVKKKDEGTTIMKFLSEYSSLNNPDGKYNFDMLSSESLMVGSSSSVRFIVAVMLRVLDAQNILNNCEMMSFYLSIKGAKHNFDMSSLVEAEQKFYPEGYEEFIQQLESKSLFEMAEEIISFFKLEKGDIAGLNCFQNQILDYMNTKGSDLDGFIEMWQSEGMSESIVLSGEQDAIRIMTIHKSKGLQFKIVIIPFINWSISIHNNTKIWVKADAYPFNMVGKFPADCYSNMKESLFANDYELERWSTALDSLNVLYVALTRAEERLYGFLPVKKSNKTDTIDRYILEAFGNDGVEGEQMVRLSNYYDKSTGIYEQGTPQSKENKTISEPSISFDYNVFTDKKRFVFRLNGTSLLKPDNKNEKAYYGTVLHDILSRVKVLDDLHTAIASAVADGLLPKDKSDEVETMILNKIESANMKEWFDEDSTVLNEPDILVGKGVVRRPDRVIIKDGKVSILDYKFGEKRRKHLSQVDEFKNILMDMGYSINKACLWYVEQNEVVTL